MQRYLSKSPEETVEIGEKIGKKIGRGATILLSGALGSGKTVLVRGIASALGISERVTSPSFTLISVYRGKYELYHVDLYRIERVDEVEDLGLEDILNSGSIVVIEWGEKIRSILPDDCIEVNINIKSGEEREIILKGISI